MECFLRRDLNNNKYLELLLELRIHQYHILNCNKKHHNKDLTILFGSDKRLFV